MELAGELDLGVRGDIVAVEFEETILGYSSGVRVAIEFEAGKPKLVRIEDTPRVKDNDWFPFSNDKE